MRAWQLIPVLILFIWKHAPLGAAENNEPSVADNLECSAAPAAPADEEFISRWRPQTCSEKNKWMELRRNWLHVYGSVSTPLNILPLLAVGLITNADLAPARLGVRGGLSGNFVAEGMHYKQANAFLNIQLDRELYAGAGLARRTVSYSLNLFGVTHSGGKETIIGWTDARRSFDTVSLYAGLARGFDSFLEFGLEIPWRKSTIKYFTHADRKYRAIDENRKSIAASRKAGRETIGVFAAIGLVYFNWGLVLF